MAASPWALILLLAAAFTAGAGATTFSITNRCSYPVWPAAIPVGGGRRLNSGDTWNLEVPGGTSAARIWGRTGCNFNGDRGSCATGDCAGALYCGLSGRPPATLAEFSLGSQDYYDISVIDGYNVPMDFSCSTGVALRCRDAGCYDAYHQPNDVRTKSCGGGNRSFRVVFCP
ncbi:thaumatin-like pathogenesis-related protein 3 [Aegilops tauschii subsp. strangulata]|uniref:thaumatin-like pathogenesis-related protein 3 n=1 Tax=Aegilops tauschii subsp. strangulata TaxID=200361 RepID=UPI00098A9212|nr:thaumatin-like pathogenesis-related protein 3 [Aegilops tauschii subsp. strangulata]